jgi:hypothetical protein
MDFRKHHVWNIIFDQPVTNMAHIIEVVSDKFNVGRIYSNTSQKEISFNSNSWSLGL